MQLSDTWDDHDYRGEYTLFLFFWYNNEIHLRVCLTTQEVAA